MNLRRWLTALAQSTGDAPTRLALVAAACTLLAACGGPWLLPGTRDCIGFPAEVCQRQVDEIQEEGRSHGGVAAYRFVCTSGSCTVAGGQGMMTVVFADGTGREGSFGYATPVATPTADGPVVTELPLTATPQCLAAPESRCQEFARAAATEAARGGQRVVSITVRCTTTCTITNGDLETRLTLGDGTVVKSVYPYRG
jgi:hypothetical protein